MLKARACGRDLVVSVWKFPCGEVGVKIDGFDGAVLTGENVRVYLEWQGNDDIIALAPLVDIIKAAGANSWSLSMPYFPYSRQDRRCSEGEAHALKVFCTILNSLGFSFVRTLDPHSYVLEALVDNLRAVSQDDCAYCLPVHDVLVAPDAGAEKKIFKHRQVESLEESSPIVLCATKFRDTLGKITGTHLQADKSDIDGKRICVVDDLCDGGATFLAVAEAIYAVGKPAELNLYVTHGMFTKGYSELMDVYNNIYVHSLGQVAPAIPECYKARIRTI